MKTLIGALLGTLSLTTAAHAVPIVIQVTGPDNAPVANAEVRVALRPSREEFSTLTEAREPLHQAARTDAKGVANFDALEGKAFPGQNADDLQYLGAATIWAPSLGAVNVTLQAGANRVQLVKAAGIARGVVRDAKGAPVTGAKVSALGLTNTPGTLAFAGRDAFAFAPGEAAFTALSDGEGRWQIGNLPLGSRANVQLIDPALAPHKANAPILAVTAPPLQAVANNALMEIDDNGVLSAVPAASLNGRVLDDKGAAVVGATVWATIKQGSNDYFPPAITTTDAQGAYEIKGLAPGSYEILVRAPQTSLLVADPAQIQKIALESGQTQTLPPQKLISGGTLEVQVSDVTDGKPLPGARVSVSREESSRAEWTFPLAGATAADGKLKLNLAPAKYRVYVVADGYVSPRVRLNGSEDEMLAIVEGKTEHREWKLTRGLSVGGRVVDEAGQALPAVMLHLSALKAGSDYSNGLFMQSNTTGVWQANNFEEGQYQVEISAGGYDQSPEWELISPKNFAVPARGPITIVARPIAKTSLSGRVVDTEGAGVVNARIVAKIGDGLPDSVTVIQREAFSDAQGNYTLPPFLANAKTVALDVERAGYIASKLPQAQNNTGRWSSSDAVLQALSAHVGGRIVNAQNEAQKGVQVLNTFAKSSHLFETSSGMSNGLPGVTLKQVFY